MSGEHKVVYGICENKCKAEVEAKLQLRLETGNFTLTDNTVHRVSSFEAFVISIEDIDDLFSSEIQFMALTGTIGVNKGDYEINVVGLELSETVDGVNYYAVEMGKIYNIMCWYDGFKVNMVCI